MKTSKYITISEIFKDNSDSRFKQIIYSTISLKWFAVDPFIVECLLSNEFDYLSSVVRSEFKESKIIVETDLNETLELLKGNERLNDKNQDYIATIMPSSSCQLGCSYCGQSHGADKMKNSIIDQTVDFITKQFDDRSYQTMNISWFGGEPLSGLSSIKEISPRLMKLSNANNAIYKAYVVTNGLLLNSKNFQILHDLGVRKIQITLDGPEKEHNNRRFLKNGQGSFRKILDNLITYSKNPFNDLAITIRVNINKENADSIENLIHLLHDKALTQIISEFDFALVFDWGKGGNNYTSQSFAKNEIGLFKTCHKLGFKLNMLPGRQNHICPTYYNDNSPLIESNGNLSNCYEYPLAFDSNESPIGRSGNTQTGVNNTKVKSRSALKQEMTNRINNEHKCMNCEFLPVCGGTCQPHIDQNNLECPTIKYNMSDRLILNYKNLKKD